MGHPAGLTSRIEVSGFWCLRYPTVRKRRMRHPARLEGQAEVAENGDFTGVEQIGRDYFVSTPAVVWLQSAPNPKREGKPLQLPRLPTGLLSYILPTCIVAN